MIAGASSTPTPDPVSSSIETSPSPSPFASSFVSDTASHSEPSSSPRNNVHSEDDQSVRQGGGEQKDDGFVNGASGTEAGSLQDMTTGRTQLVPVSGQTTEDSSVRAEAYLLDAMMDFDPTADTFLDGFV